MFERENEERDHEAAEMRVKRKIVKSQELVYEHQEDDNGQIIEREAEAQSQFSRDIVSKSCLELSFALQRIVEVEDAQRSPVEHHVNRQEMSVSQILSDDMSLEEIKASLLNHD